MFNDAAPTLGGLNAEFRSCRRQTGAQSILLWIEVFPGEGSQLGRPPRGWVRKNLHIDQRKLDVARKALGAKPRRKPSMPRSTRSHSGKNFTEAYGVCARRVV